MKLTEIKDGEILKAYVCSRCGCVEFAGSAFPPRCQLSPGDFNYLPGWLSNFGGMTLCPECSKDFHGMVDQFINAKPHPQGHGIEVTEDEG